MCTNHKRQSNEKRIPHKRRNTKHEGIMKDFPRKKCIVDANKVCKQTKWEMNASEEWRHTMNESKTQKRDECEQLKKAKRMQARNERKVNVSKEWKQKVKHTLCTCKRILSSNKCAQSYDEEHAMIWKHTQVCMGTNTCSEVFTNITMHPLVYERINKYAWV